MVGRPEEVVICARARELTVLTADQHGNAALGGMGTKVRAPAGMTNTCTRSSSEGRVHRGAAVTRARELSCEKTHSDTPTCVSKQAG